MFPKVPKPVFKKGTNIKQLLCRSKVPPVRNINTRATARENQRGVTRCNKGLNRNNCRSCLILTSNPREVIKEVKVHSSGQTIQIEEKINCKTKNVLYLLEEDVKRSRLATKPVCRPDRSNSRDKGGAARQLN